MTGSGEEGFINPFATDQALQPQPVERKPHITAIGELVVPATTEEIHNRPAEEMAREAANRIASVVIDSKIDPASLSFEDCASTEILQPVLDRLDKTPIGLGWGPQPARVQHVWDLFLDTAISNHRRDLHVPKEELVPFSLKIPEWLQRSNSIDLLSDCTLVDVTLLGDITCSIAKKARFSRIRIDGSMRGSGITIGTGAEKCDFIINGDLNGINMYSARFFEGAKSVNIHIDGSVVGLIGTIDTSKIFVRGDATNSKCYYQGTCEFSPNIQYERHSR